MKKKYTNLFILTALLIFLATGCNTAKLVSDDETPRTEASSTAGNTSYISSDKNTSKITVPIEETSVTAEVSSTTSAQVDTSSNTAEVGSTTSGQVNTGKKPTTKKPTGVSPAVTTRAPSGNQSPSANTSTPIACSYSPNGKHELDVKTINEYKTQTSCRRCGHIQSCIVKVPSFENAILNTESGRHYWSWMTNVTFEYEYSDRHEIGYFIRQNVSAGTTVDTTKQSLVVTISKGAKLVGEALTVSGKSIKLEESVQTLRNRFGNPTETLTYPIAKWTAYVYAGDYKNLLIVYVHNEKVVGFTTTALTMKYKSYTAQTKLDGFSSASDESGRTLSLYVDRNSKGTGKIYMISVYPKSLLNEVARQMDAAEGKEAFYLLNGVRSAYGTAQTISWNAEKAQKCANYSDLMYDKGFDHGHNDGGDNWMSECIARGSLRGVDVIAAWMGSEMGHRRSILYEVINGTGAIGRSGMYWTLRIY